MKVVRAFKLMKADFLGSSDPYVKLNLTGETLPGKKTTVKKKNLNPEWNEDFKLAVREPETQVLQIQVFDWDKVFMLQFVAARTYNSELKKTSILYFESIFVSKTYYVSFS